ncbi:hypothetical protein [Gelidibacter sp.]|uniref:hypothetical protein n=1 Tax=Gelidibacter sp. TaxID=2018083 RepID=UPI003264B926
MKNMKNFLLVVLIAGTCSTIIAQENPIDVKFRRSSLHTMVVETDKFPKKEVVLNAFNNAPFPEKYNDHQIGVKSFDPGNYTLTSEEKETIYKQSKLGAFAASASGLETDSLSKELPLRIQKYLTKEKVANAIVAKWFNRQADGSFYDELISERGIFNASFLDLKSSQSAADGNALLKTAGLELIDNTFIVINKFKFVPNEPIARVIRDAAREAIKDKPALLLGSLNKGIDAVYEKTKEGYSIWATSYLYKLVWDEATANTFYTEFYMDKSTLNADKKLAFENSDLFKLEFIGDESASGLVTFSLTEKRTEDQIIELSTIRIIDNVYAKLQKKYDVFKTITPLYTGVPITAKIGKKEGLEGGEKFEVLEMIQDEKTGVNTYKSVGTIKVDKNLIWDNTFDTDEATSDGNAATIDRTTFTGGKKFASGMLIKQVK